MAENVSAIVSLRTELRNTTERYNQMSESFNRLQTSVESRLSVPLASGTPPQPEPEIVEPSVVVAPQEVPIVPVPNPKPRRRFI